MSNALAVALLICAIVAAFLPVRENAFVSLDDRKNFLQNGAFRGLGFSHLAWAWTSRDVGVYEPLGRMSLEVEYVLWGLDPRGYHLASLAIYAATMVALYALAVQFVGRSRPVLWREDPSAICAGACLAVMLCAVHPLRVQLVAWASCQTYVTCALFSILTALAYVHAHPDATHTRRGWLAGSLLLFAAALLSKAPAVTLPAVLLALDIYPLARVGPGRWRGPAARRVYLEKVPFALLSGLFAVLAFWARARAATPVAGHGLEARVARAFYNVVFYLTQTGAPSRISACYPVPLRMTLREPRFWLSAVAVAGISALLIALRRRLPGALVAWAVYLVMLAPSSGLFRTGGPYVAADRYCFLPMMGLAVLAASLLSAGLSRKHRAWRLAILLAGSALVLALTLRTRDECRHWHDSKSLWSHAVAVSADPNPFALQGLAMALAAEPGRLPEAQALLEQAIRIAPEYAALHSALTSVLARQGRVAEALAHAREAVRLAPESVVAWVNLGNATALAGDPRGAKTAFAKALALDPNDADAHGNLGMLLNAEGQTAEAEAHLTEALRQNPDSPNVRRALEELRKRGRPEGH